MQSCVPLGMPFVAAWSSGLCDVLNPNPRCDPNPRWSRKSLVGVRLVPSRKVWRELCCVISVSPLPPFCSCSVPGALGFVVF